MNMKLKKVIDASGLGKLGQGNSNSYTQRDPYVPGNLSEMNSTGQNKKQLENDRDFFGNVLENPGNAPSPMMSRNKQELETQKY